MTANSSIPKARARGWFLPSSSMLVLASNGGWLLMDSRGEELGRFDGEIGRHLEARLQGNEIASPLLRAVLAHSPGLTAALGERAIEVSERSVIARDEWALLFVELTARCNERCSHCYASSAPERTETLDRPTVEAVIREAAKIGFDTIQLTGGEALLCPFLADAARLARDEGIAEVEIYTNGVLLNEQRYAELRDVGVRFAVSLYARSPDIHDSITGLRGSHQLTTDAIRRAVEGGSHIRVGVIATQPDLEAEARAAIGLARELGVPEERIGIDVARGVGRGLYGGRELERSPESDGSAAGSRQSTHGALRGGKAAVLPDGRVTPCIFSRDVTLGHVGPAGGLSAALDRPAARLRLIEDAAEVRRALRRGCSSLTCGECRIATSLLEPTAHGPISGARRSIEVLQ